MLRQQGGTRGRARVGPYLITGEVQQENGCHSLIAGHVERVGHDRAARISKITPPMHWLFPKLREDAITHAD